MKNRIGPLAAFAAVFALSACTSAPPTAPPAPSPETAAAAQSEDKVAGQHKAKWGMATEADVAAALDKKFEQAVKGWTKLTKDGVVMFCKRYKPMGSSISQIRCLTEAEVRAQVENMNQYRDQMRSAGKCPHGPQGCRS